MMLDIQIINHNYITRVVIFSIFLYKNYRNDEVKYEQNISKFLKSKFGSNFIIKIDVGPKLEINEKREYLLDKLLNDGDIENLNLVSVKFKTPLKEMNIQINLNLEDNYEEYLNL